MPIAVLVLAAAIVLLSRHFSSSKLVAEVYSDGTLIMAINLGNAEDALLAISGKPNVTLSIKGSKIAFASSDCKDKLCLMVGYIHYAGEQVVCLPNRVAIKLRSEGAQSIDAVL